MQQRCQTPLAPASAPVTTGWPPHEPSPFPLHPTIGPSSPVRSCLGAWQEMVLRSRLGPGTWASCSPLPHRPSPPASKSHQADCSQLISCPLHVWKQMPRDMLRGRSRTEVRLTSSSSSSFPFLKIRAISLFSSHSPLPITMIFHR